MASVFKPKHRSGKNDPWQIEYTDEYNKRRRKTGFTDKRLSVELGAQLEREARKRRTGLIDSAEEKRAQQKSLPIEVHLGPFQASMGSRTTEKHVKLTMSRVRRVIEHACIETLSHIDIESVEQALFEIQEEDDLGNRTVNHYMQAIDSFCNWLVPNRLTANPLHGMVRLNAEVDVRRKRRALSPSEMARLIKSARESGESIQCYSGEERARFYEMSYFTGLRRRELGSLTKRSFSLNSVPPTLTVKAACSKHRREDTLPLHPELESKLRKWLRGLKPGDKLFPLLERRRTWLCVKKDLERIGIPYRTHEGVADFHAAGRHSHITGLLESGATLAEAKELARHSDVRMTMRYAHINIKSQAKALSSLPSPAVRPAAASSGFVSTSDRPDSHSASFADNDSHTDDDAEKKITPDDNRGYVATCGDKPQTGTPHASVEAAGIEPASREISMQASTCVVDYLVFDTSGPCRPGPDAPSENLFDYSRTCVNCSGSELVTSFRASPTNPLSRGSLFLGCQCEVTFGK